MQPDGCFIYARVASLPQTCHLHPSTRLPYNRAGPVSHSWYLFQPRPHVSLGNTRALISTPRNSLLFKIYFERGYSVPDIMLQRVKSWKRQFQNCMIPHTPRSLLWQGSSNLMLITSFPFSSTPSTLLFVDASSFSLPSDFLMNQPMYEWICQCMNESLNRGSNPRVVNLEYIISP